MESNLNIKKTDTPKLNVETVSSAVFGKEEGGSNIGGGSGESIRNIHKTLSKLSGHVRKALVRIKALEGKFSEVETKLVTNTEKIERIVKIQKILENKKGNKKDNIGGNQKDLTKSLIETNKILVQIQQELMKNISIQSGNEKDKQDKVKRTQSKNKLKKEESQLEKSSKKLGSSIAKASDKILSPVKGIFGQIMDFVGTLVLGIGANAIFKWLENKENQEKVQGWFDWIKDHWKWVAAGIGVLFALPLVGAIAGVISTIGSLVGVIASLATPLLGLMLNPLFWKILLAIGAGILIYKAGEWVVKGIRRNMVGGEGFVDAHDALDDRLKRDGLGIEKTFFGMGKARGYVLPTKENNYMGSFDLTPEQQAIVDDTINKRKKLDDLKKTMEDEITTKREAVDPSKFQGTGTAGPSGSPTSSNSLLFDERERIKAEVEDSYLPKIQSIINPGGIEARALGGPTTAGKIYEVGEKGRELFAPNVDGSVINNMRTEKIYEMISSGRKGRGGVNIQTLSTITNQLPPPEVKVPSGPATEVPDIASVNMADPYRQLTPMLYGITV